MRPVVAASAALILVIGALLLPLRRVPTVGFVPQIRAAMAVGNFRRADRMIAAYRGAHGDTPEALEALSWLGRGALGRKNLDAADRYADETYQAATAALEHRQLDAESHLPIALGAAIEVQAQAAAERGERSGAVGFLTDQLARFGATSIAPRIQKNINLLTLEGRPVPPLTATEFLGPHAPEASGRPRLLFFWAHWCPDCKAMAPIVAAVEEAHRADGLIVIGPTQRYGYVQAGTSAPPDKELAHIDDVRRRSYAALATMPVTVSNQDFLTYGVSTTPTLVLANRDGVVTTYHPGRATRAELEAMVEKALSPVGTGAVPTAGGASR